MEPLKEAVKGVVERRCTGAANGLRTHSASREAGAHTQWGQSGALERGLIVPLNPNLQSLQNPQQGGKARKW